MAYSTIARAYTTGLCLAAGGAALAYHCIGAETASSTYALFLGITWIAAVAAIVGLFACARSFLGALRNLVPLEDQSWFRLVLVLGVYTLTLAGMAVYLVFRPDRESVARSA